MTARVDGLISVVIPVYNRPAQLRNAVASVLEQDYRPIEVLIVDDGSTDGETRHTAEELAKQWNPTITVLSQPNSGPGVARETGRREARGEFIQYLDSDDILLPGKFAAQVSALRSTPDADVAYGITLYRDHSGLLNPSPHKDTGIRREDMFPSFINSRWWDTATPLYRRSICDRAGPWIELRIEEDWEYDCRIACLGARLVYCPIPVSETRDHSGARLCRGSIRDQTRMRMRAQSHSLVWRHILAAGLHRRKDEELAIFARSLFLLARQCGAASLSKESKSLHRLAMEAAVSSGAPNFDMKIFGITANLVGWTLAGFAAERLDKFRRSRSIQQ